LVTLSGTAFSASRKLLARRQAVWLICAMRAYLGKLLFPNDRGSARRRKLRFLWIALVLGLAASALVGYVFIWAYNSGRF